MKKFSTARDLGARLDLSTQVLVSHIDRGTVTPPVGYIENARGRRDFFWDPADSPTLDLLGATALVPASDEMAMQEIKYGFYATPCRSSGHLGRWSGFPALGLCHKSRATIYTVTGVVRIGFLDPVRDEHSYWRDIPTAEGDSIIDAAALSDADRDTLRTVCRSRTYLHGGGKNEMVDPREIAVYRLDVEHPIATDVELRSIVRGASWTIDPVNENTRSVDTYKLDAVAEWAGKNG